MTTATRAVRVGSRSVPVVLPDLRDARLHTAAVIISIHTIGIIALGFRVSVPQIVSSIVTAAIIDVALTLRSTGKLVWPASGMLTGSGVALILRLVGMEAGHYWSWAGWYWFALVAAASILTKYLIRHRGSHIFNPSNVGLVAAFLVLGSGVVEPLDFWWAPLGLWMVLAYVLIIGGGAIITRRLHLLEMAVVFWMLLVSGLAVLAASGHCLVVSWSPAPVCGERFWTVLATSPEVLVFVFFMITDPKTIPHGRLARVAFAATLGVISVLMIAPHAVEYGAKVGLLASLAIWSPLRWIFDRALPDIDPERSGLAELVARLRHLSPVSVFSGGVAAGAAVVFLAIGIVAAGVPARGLLPSPTSSVDLHLDVDTAGLPEVNVDRSVYELDLEVNDEFVDQLTTTLAENLVIEAEAIHTADGSLLALADGGDRLDEMQANLDTAIATGERWTAEYSFDSLRLSLHEAEDGQTSAGLVFSATGTVDRVLYGPDGAERSRESGPLIADFVLRQIAGDRWLIVDTSA